MIMYTRFELPQPGSHGCTVTRRHSRGICGVGTNRSPRSFFASAVIKYESKLLS